MDTTSVRNLHRAVPSGAADEHVLDRSADKLTGKPAGESGRAVPSADEKLPRGLRIALGVALGVLSWGLVFALVRWIAF
ncbi:hypothetical protein [Hyphococcus sp.]|uniref:hypothetical protein n=1 Tax=Hyphococcus sp. TaxID=2038636 RepID=UPI003D14BA72